MPRTPKTPAATPAVEAAPALSSPVVLDRTRLQIGDMKLFAAMSSVGKDADAANALLPAMIDMLDRIVIGGVSTRPLGEMAAVMQAVGAQMSAIGNPKN